MPLYTLSTSELTPVPATSFGDQRVSERQLQHALRAQIEIVAPGCMVLAEEFGDWDESRRRIDLLCLDKSANLVVVELKRTDDGGHMELQALRYAAMVSTMTFERAVHAHARYLAKLGEGRDAEQAILDFLDWEEPLEDDFAQDVRIILASADFSKEITTAVLWLNERDVDITCFRLAPYDLSGQVVIEARQIVPLPEAADYQIRAREKERKERVARTTARDYTKFDVTVDGQTYERQAKRSAVFLVVRAACERGVTPEEIERAIQWRGPRVWYSVDGTLDAEQFAKAASKEERPFDPRRWFCAEGELIHHQGRTHAFTNQWGGEARRALTDILRGCPTTGIEVEEAA